jgi:hypothetical protein
MKKIDKKEKFIYKSIEKFKNKYDYSLIKYVNSQEKIEIKCNKHDIIFEQTPSEHLRGKNGCKLCSNSINNNEDFIINAKEVHGDEYDYSLTNYINSYTKVKIICSKHGVFEKIPNAHIKNKQGCPICSKEIKNINKKYTNELFIDKAKKTHGNKYDYSLVEYISSNIKVKIICPEHGEFEQIPSGHIRGKGCEECGLKIVKDKLRKSTNSFIIDTNEIHGDKYDYSLVEYVNAKGKVKIVCPEHGVFEQKAEDHINGHGCKECGLKYQYSENELKAFISELNIEFESSNNKLIAPKHIDVYIPSHNIGFEFDGLYWHSELYKDNDYHLNKTIDCGKKNVKLIHIFEDEWIYKQDIVKSRIKNLLRLSDNKIFARKCIIKEVKTNDKTKFLDNNHIQGAVGSTVNLGLYYNNELVSIMTFGLLRKSMGQISKENNYELLRFCNKLNTNVIGGASKLLKHFINNYKPVEIISYADKRWSQGNLYNKLGFDFIHDSNPNYWYIINKTRKHRFAYRKDVLVKEGFDSTKSEHEIMKDRGIYRIYDCGNSLYKLKI